MTHDDDIELLKKAFPAFTCICELCDCGRHKHHKDCKRNVPKTQALREKPLTDYQATFKAVQDPRPRSNKRPPQTPRDPHPPNMILKTNQREEFQPYDVVKDGRPPAFVQDTTYVPGNQPFDGMTYYKQTYTPKPLENLVSQRMPPGKARNPGQFDSRTTYKEFHKQWVPQVTKSYGEMPVFTGSILYPDRTTRDDMKTVMRDSYPGAVAKKQEPAKIPQGNILIEGDQDHHTVHRDTYKNIRGDHRVKTITYDPEPTIQRGNFFGETQQMRDFPPYKNGRRQPRPPNMVEPAPETINLKFNNNTSFDTEQRHEFKGIDTNRYPAPKTMKQGTTTYEPPTEKFATMTVQKTDYVPKDLGEANAPKARMPRRKETDKGKFDGHTTNKEHYKNWKPNPRIKHGDFYEAVTNNYVPPRIPFVAQSTTRATFTPKDGRRPADFKPEQVPFDTQGKHDFRTVNKLTYKGQKPQMCQVDAYLLQQKLIHEQNRGPVAVGKA
ncbi:stabilizer of axonemal microtubules 1-like [Lineus longissimus]|uniref:stabilizer of axonemal microtubules 1-like n=1 Tax=Lineus longissimus TaxID=88925 RepID=UPI002B4E6C24